MYLPFFAIIDNSVNNIFEQTSVYLSLTVFLEQIPRNEIGDSAGRYSLFFDILFFFNYSFNYFLSPLLSVLFFTMFSGFKQCQCIQEIFIGRTLFPDCATEKVYRYIPL